MPGSGSEGLLQGTREISGGQPRLKWLETSMVRRCRQGAGADDGRSSNAIPRRECHDLRRASAMENAGRGAAIPVTPYVGRVSVRVYAVFGRVAAVCRYTTCAALRAQGHDNWRVSVRHTLAPTIARRPKAAEVGEGHAKRAHAPLLQPAAWGVEPKAGPAGRIGDSRCMKERKINAGEPGGSEPPRRLSGRRCGAHCARQ